MILNRINVGLTMYYEDNCNQMAFVLFYYDSDVRVVINVDEYDDSIIHIHRTEMNMKQKIGIKN